MLETVEKTTALPPDFPSRTSLPDFFLSDVLPTDAIALTELLIASVYAKVVAYEHIAHAKSDGKPEAKEEYEIRLRELYEQITPGSIPGHALMRRMFGASTKSAAQFHLFNEEEILSGMIPPAEIQDTVPLPEPKLTHSFY